MLSRLIAQFRDMPVMLSVATLASLGLGVVSLGAPLVPGMIFDLAGTRLAGRELWTMGVAFALFPLGLLMLAVAVGIVGRCTWVKPLLVALPIAQMLPFWVVHAIFPAPNPTPVLSEYLLLCGGWAGIVALYLFGSARVREYFSRVHWDV